MNWEYKVIQIDNAVKVGVGKFFGGALSYNTELITNTVNAEGNNGWELTEVIAPVGTTGTATQLLMFFKRQKL